MKKSAIAALFGLGVIFEGALLHWFHAGVATSEAEHLVTLAKSFPFCAVDCNALGDLDLL